MSEIAAALPEASSRRATFVPGDKVVVVAGDLVNLEGIVTQVRAHGWMHGWMDGCMDGWMDGWMDAWMDWLGGRV